MSKTDPYTVRLERETDDLIEFIAGHRDPDICLKPLLTPKRRLEAIEHQRRLKQTLNVIRAIEGNWKQ